MKLVIGGIASGKRSYVRSLGYDDAQMSADPRSSCPVLVDLEELLRKGEPSEELWGIIRDKDVVICCEVGQGVVPLDATERAWRELVGRSCAQLAGHATHVVRLCCGIPLALK